MRPMLGKTFWDLRWATFWYSVGAAAYVFPVSLFYPTVKAQSATFAHLIATYPKGMLSALGYRDMLSFTGYMSVEALNIFWPLIVAVFATLSGAALVAREVEDGTSEIWLMVPASRWRLLLGKMVAVVLGLLIAVVTCLVTVELSAITVGADVRPRGLLAMGLNMAVFLLAVAAYSSLLSALMSSRGLAAGISFGLTMASYALWLVGGLSDKWKVLQDFSLFTAYSPETALESGSVDLGQLALVLLVAVLCGSLALLAFQRRDAI